MMSSLLCIVGELAGEGSVAVVVGVAVAVAVAVGLIGFVASIHCCLPIGVIG